MSAALIGKYFLCVHDECWRSGIVEAAVNDGHYIVRFDDLVRFNEGAVWPESLAVAAISNMVENGGNDVPPPWLFFDNPEQRAKYEAWLNEPRSRRKPPACPAAIWTQKEELMGTPPSKPPVAPLGAITLPEPFLSDTDS